MKVAFSLPMVSFITHAGDVNFLARAMLGDQAVLWTPYSQGGLQFEFTLQGVGMSGPDNLGREERCAFWRSLGSIMPY